MSTDNPTTGGATAVTGEAAPDPAPSDPKDHRPHSGGGEHGAHPTDTQYMLIALGLTVITAIEVAISYAKELGDAANPLLLILAAIKFFMVVSYFMHLRFDNRLFRRFLITGIVLAAVVYTIVFFTLGIFTVQHGIHG
jgi:cytochrome c oxidase subunit 4